jgi:hypothetical protein
VSSATLALSAWFLMWLSSKRRGEHGQAYLAVLGGFHGSSAASGGDGFHAPPWFDAQLLQWSSGDHKASVGDGVARGSSSKQRIGMGSSGIAA